jgi:hypothetical protein
MIRTIFAAALLVGVAAPAFADEMMMCDDASIMKAEEAAKMMDASHKNDMEMAMKEVDMAKASMKGGMKDDCMKHLDEAMKHTMMQ